MKKTVIASMGMLVFLTLSGGCANTSQGEVPGIDDGSTEAYIQMVEAQDKTTMNVGEEQDTTIFIDEKLDENLFISAELKMPENNLYEYVTQLKSFDYDIVQEAISTISTGQNTEGNLVFDDGSDEFTGGSLTYQRNDMATHLDTYCSYEIGRAHV